jgi:hypothetical protein
MACCTVCSLRARTRCSDIFTAGVRVGRDGVYTSGFLEVTSGSQGFDIVGGPRAAARLGAPDDVLAFALQRASRSLTDQRGDVIPHGVALGQSPYAQTAGQYVRRAGYFADRAPAVGPDATSGSPVMAVVGGRISTRRSEGASGRA